MDLRLLALIPVVVYNYGTGDRPLVYEIWSED